MSYGYPKSHSTVVYIYCNKIDHVKSLADKLASGRKVTTYMPQVLDLIDDLMRECDEYVATDLQT
jgi:hypothetical protein